MRTLVVQQNQVEYVGVFERPALSLWGDGRRILDGLFMAFEGLHSGLSAFRTLGESDAPASQGVSVSLGRQCSYRFKFERVEGSLLDFDDDDLARLRDVLARGDKWVRATLPTPAFKSHLFTYGSHSSLSEGTSKEFLKELSSLHVLERSQNLGSGIIFHADIPDKGWRIQLVVDHSLSVSDGLFVQMLVAAQRDTLNYAEALSDGRSLLDSSLEHLGLKFGKAT
jgi:hypothetical protein